MVYQGKNMVGLSRSGAAAPHQWFEEGKVPDQQHRDIRDRANGFPIRGIRETLRLGL
jgi:hypothetical protein